MVTVPMVNDLKNSQKTENVLSQGAREEEEEMT